MRFIKFHIILVWVFSTFAFAQEKTPPKFPQPFNDSLKVDTSRVRDTTKADSLAKKDSAAASSGIDTVVNYSAKDSVVYSINSKKMSMYNNGDIKYRDMRLTAERVNVNWATSILDAHGIPDTTKDSVKTKRESPDETEPVKADTARKKFKGIPMMKDGPETYHGSELSYNFKTKKGKINVGETHMDEGYYRGQDIKKVDPDVLFIQDGRYTTCDAAEPHYYFASPRMKVMAKDKIVAEPVYLYIADVPVFALPFAVFPNKSGRRSGLIMPAYGENSGGRFLRNLGYFWAISDYMDLTTKTDLYTEGGWTLNSLYRYGKRYDFTGTLTSQYRNVITGEGSDPNATREKAYNVNITHSQTIDPSTHLDANFTFASNNSYQNTLDLNQALQQTIASNASFSHSWEGTPNSISMSISRQQNLQDGSSDLRLPSVSFSHSQSYPFRSDNSLDESSPNLKWYENVGLSYGASSENHVQRISRSIAGIKTDSGGTAHTQSLQTFETDRTQDLEQNSSISISPKLGYFTVTPSFSFSDNRTFAENDIPGISGDSSGVAYGTQRTAIRNGTLNTGVSIGTRMYGIIQPGILGVAAIRHTLTPSLAFSYNKQVYGANFPPKQELMSFNLSNLFEMKTVPKEEGKEGNKIELMNIGTGLSYDFGAESLKFLTIPVNFRTGIGNLLNVDGSANYDLYRLVQGPAGYQRINSFEFSSGGKLARLTSFHVGLSTSLSGEKNQAKAQAAALQGADTSTAHNMRSGIRGLYDNEEPDFSIPWNLSLGFDYSETKDPPGQSHSTNLRGDLSFNLTENWKFSANGSYDVTNKQFAAPNINISRDLHCWIMNFSWVPIGNYRNFQFEIRIKASQLQDIKVTKSGSDSNLR